MPFSDYGRFDHEEARDEVTDRCYRCRRGTDRSGGRRDRVVSPFHGRPARADIGTSDVPRRFRHGSSWSVETQREQERSTDLLHAVRGKDGDQPGQTLAGDGLKVVEIDH